MWYSATQSAPKVHQAIYSRPRLLPYFSRRHLRGERLRLTSFRFNAWRASDSTVHFQYTLKRRARDLRADVSYVGKGAASCDPAPPRLIVWSMGSGSG
jgi:hypothetical protein